MIRIGMIGRKTGGEVAAMANFMGKRVVACRRSFHGECFASHSECPFAGAGEEECQLAFMAMRYRHDATERGQRRRSPSLNAWKAVKYGQNMTGFFGSKNK